MMKMIKEYEDEITEKLINHKIKINDLLSNCNDYFKKNIEYL